MCWYTNARGDGGRNADGTEGIGYLFGITLDWSEGEYALSSPR